MKKLTGIKKAMTKTMTESLSIPFFTFQDQIEATQLLKLRREMKKAQPKLTILPFFVKALSLAMLPNPVINSQFNPETDENGYIKSYVVKKNHNFAIAIDSKDGLTVPNIKRVQEKSILEINEEILNIREKAEKGGLKASDFEDSTFTISSVGNMGGTYFVPTILRPQVAIIAIGGAKKLPKYVEEPHGGYKWVPADIIHTSMSCDHRVLDGGSVAKFTKKFKELIENPNLMMLSMN